jgi:hypothetical protein
VIAAFMTIVVAVAVARWWIGAVAPAELEPAELSRAYLRRRRELRSAVVARRPRGIVARLVAWIRGAL